MNLFLRNIALVLCVWLSMAGVCLGKQVYLRDGGIVECESIWRHGDIVTVKVNRDTVVDFESREIDMRRTFQEPRRKRHRAAPASKAAVAPSTAVKMQNAEVVPAPVAAAVQVAATGPAAVPTPVSDVPAAKPSPSPAIPAPGPAKKEETPPQASESAPKVPLDKAEFERRTREVAEMMAQAVRNKDPELLKKAVEAQKELIEAQKGTIQTGNNGPPTALPSSGVGLKLLLFFLVVSLLIVASLWVVFEKAGESGWKSLVPLYNMYVLMKVSDKPGWWFFLLLLPLAGTAFYILAMLSLAAKFGRGPLFAIGLCFLPMIFFPLLAFGGSRQGVIPGNVMYE